MSETWSTVTAPSVSSSGVVSASSCLEITSRRCLASPIPSIARSTRRITSGASLSEPLKVLWEKASASNCIALTAPRLSISTPAHMPVSTTSRLLRINSTTSRKQVPTALRVYIKKAPRRFCRILVRSRVLSPLCTLSPTCSISRRRSSMCTPTNALWVLASTLPSGGMSRYVPPCSRRARTSISPSGLSTRPLGAMFNEMNTQRTPATQHSTCRNHLRALCFLSHCSSTLLIVPVPPPLTRLSSLAGAHRVPHLPTDSKRPGTNAPGLSSSRAVLRRSSTRQRASPIARTTCYSRWFIHCFANRDTHGAGTFGDLYLHHFRI